jgi:hypothetical protein
MLRRNQRSGVNAEVKPAWVALANNEPGRCSKTHFLNRRSQAARFRGGRIVNEIVELTAEVESRAMGQVSTRSVSVLILCPLVG